jgi:putative aldouronate transport system substrate-binding protein
MKLNRKLALGSAALAISGLALTGCGASGGSGDGSKDSITWMALLHTPTTPEKGGAIETALEEVVGKDLDFQWIPAASKDEKLNAAIASDNLADIVPLSLTESTARRALTSGQFWDIEPFLADFPSLSKIDPQILDASKIDGTLYGVPAQKPKARYGVLIRQDWLDALGLQVPHTTEELAAVARAFTDEDPDGNGKNDTTGILDRSESFDLGFRSLSGYFGAGSVFEVNDDDEVVASFTTEPFIEAMEWYRDLYQDGAVTQEFVTIQKQNQQDAIAQGKGGIVLTGLFEAKNYMALAQSSDPDTPMAWALVNDMTHEDVPRRILSDTNGGIGGVYAISKSSVKNEEQLKVVLGVLDKLLSEEAFDLMTNGIEGTHFEYEADGAVTIIDQTTWEQEVQPFSSSRMSETIKTFPSSTPYVDEGAEKMAENDDYAIVDISQSLTSDTYDSRWTEVLQSARDAYNKYMVGQLDIDGYQKAVDGLLAGDLGKIQDEFTEAYAKVNG